MKRKSDFPELNPYYANPFDNKNFDRMVHKEWADRKILSNWRVENSKFLKDPKLIEHLDIDELITQWDKDPRKRKCNPKTCIMVYKELCLVLRLIDCEHQDAIKNDRLPGVFKSSREDKYIYVAYDLTKEDPRKCTRVEKADSEFDAYWAYMQNRNTMIESSAVKALEAGLIDPDIYDQYFYDLDTIAVRPYEYYKEKKYLEEMK